MITAAAVATVAVASREASAIERVFVQFDGVTLAHGDVDDAAVDRTAIAALAITLPGYAGDSMQRAAVLSAVRADWAAYAIDIVDVRPDGDDWSMVVVSSSAPLGAGVAGAAVLDCDDGRGTGDVVFAFDGDGVDTRVLAATISQEVAHAYGLEHVDDPSDLLHPLASSGDAAFLDDCLPLVSGSSCDDVHQRHCDAGAQNSHAELLARIGPTVPDQGPPAVELVSPGDGERVVAGVDLEVLVEASDDTRVERVVLLEGDRELGEDRTPPWEFVVTAVPVGAYTLRARAIDAAGNERDSEPVTLMAQAGAPPGDFSRGSTPASGCHVGERDASGSQTGACVWLIAVLGLTRRAPPRTRGRARSRTRPRPAVRRSWGSPPSRPRRAGTRGACGPSCSRRAGRCSRPAAWCPWG